MKTYLLFVTICISISFVHAQVPKTVTVNTPGTLESVLTSTELINTTSLVVKGKINELDFLTMRIKMSALVSVDISETDVMESTRNGYTYPANEIPKYALSENIKIRAINEKGKKIEISGKGLLAQAISHEIDHLNGILFVDKVSAISKRLISKKLQKMKKETLKSLTGKEE